MSLGLFEVPFFNNGIGSSDPDIAEAAYMSLQSGVDIATHNLVFVEASGRLGIAHYADVGRMPCIGMADTSILAFEIGKIITKGIIEDLSWNWLSGKKLFVSNSGLMGQVVPTAGIVQPVGIALSPTKIFFNISHIAVRRA